MNTIYGLIPESLLLATAHFTCSGLYIGAVMSLFSAVYLCILRGNEIEKAET